MPLFTADLVMDVKLQYLKDNVTKIVLLTGVPNNFTDANTNNGTSTGQKLVEVTTTTTDFTLSDGPTDGRQITAAEKDNLTPVANGDATYFAWLDTVNSVVLHYAPLPATFTVATANEVKIPAHSYIDRDTTAVA